jgi:hypothetical protein
MAFLAVCGGKVPAMTTADGTGLPECAGRGLQEEPAPRRRGRRPLRHVTVERIELKNTGVVVRNSRVAEENRAHAAAWRVEQLGPGTLNLPILQQVKAKPVPVEAQAGLEVADHYHGMMDAIGHGTRA